LCIPETTQAAAFNTGCNLSVTAFGAPARTCDDTNELADVVADACPGIVGRTEASVVSTDVGNVSVLGRV